MPEFFLPTEADTAAFGRRLARWARKGDVFALFGTLGMGKSVLARAFVQELTGTAEVPSPTFTLVQSYEAPDFEIYHFDLYRLKSPEEIFEIGVEEALYEGVSLIEWPEKMGAYLPRGAFRITLSNHEGGRRLTIENASAAERLKSL
ncbi:MAG: tRNA (adenosine(37)-N6)-threonylcarbamoyltransferase complex ATPase subunit type 1 TsaE [Alphaproteobacteria bacterium]|nr:tRNA (adenosine(37)-N6)-threonylcarbamoyltransferase complex ATPase subunit type 1 TsaE [Alphaproteobacteria bacterium]